jgi:integrase
MVATGATFADAAAEYLRYAEQDRGCKPSTLRDYRSRINSRLLPEFGDRRLEEITSRDIERWRARIVTSSGEPLTNKSKNNLLVLLHAIFRRAVTVYGLPYNPVATVEPHRVRPSGDIEVFSPEEVWALARAAASEQDRAIYLTAAFTGLRRGELLALRWRDVDFAGHTIRVRANWAARALTTPKSGKVRSVPMAPDVARRSPSSANETSSRPTTTWSSPASPAATSTATRYPVATAAPSSARTCARFASTTSATPSERA